MLLDKLVHFLQGSHRPSHFSLRQRKMKKPWKTRTSWSFYGKLESELLQMSRCVCACVCCSFHYSINSVFIHSEANLLILILVSITCFLGDLLENPGRDQCIAAPECSCCSDFSTRRTWWWREAKRLSNRWIPGKGRGGRLEWTESSGSASSAAGTQEQEPHLWSHR